MQQKGVEWPLAGVDNLLRKCVEKIGLLSRLWMGLGFFCGVVFHNYLIINVYLFFECDFVCAGSKLAIVSLSRCFWPSLG